MVLDDLISKDTVYSGQIIKYKKDRGFGFIRCSEISSEVFFHFRNIIEGENSKLFLAINERDDIFPLDVNFTITDGERGLQAFDIRIRNSTEFAQHLIIKPLENLFRLEALKSDSDLVGSFYRLVKLKSFFYIDRSPVIRANVRRRIIQSAQAWDRVVELSTSVVKIDELLIRKSWAGPDATVAQEFFTLLGNRLGFQLKSNTKPDYFPGRGIITQQICHFINPLRYFREDRTLYMTILKDSDVFSTTVREEPDLIASKPNLLNLIIVLEENSNVIEDILKESQAKLAYISQEAILDMILGNEDRFKIELGRIVRRVLSKDSLQPFVAGSEYNEILFAGRLNERLDILDSYGNNYIVYGGRKIGKTWLVKDIIHRCKKEPYKSRYFTIYHTLQSIYSTKEAVEEIEEKIREIDEGLLPRSLPEEPLSRLKSILTRVNKLTGKTVLLALDEVDDLLKHDTSLFKRLRQMQDNNEGAFKYILAGFKDLLFATTEQTNNNPIANFKDIKISLGCLSPAECHQFVVSLIKASGFDFKPNENVILEKIYELTSGHPYYTQLLCKNIVDESLKHGEKVINEDDVNKAASPNFYSEIFNIFEDNLSNLQRLIGKIFTGNDYVFSDSDIQKSISERFGINIETQRINREMRILHACSVFVLASPNTYRPLMPQINNKFFENQDDHWLAVNYLEKPNEY